MVQDLKNQEEYKNMASITCKTCRRLAMSVCGREKCAFKMKPYPPGIHGQLGTGKRRRISSSEFGSQLKEKQRLKFSYGLREKQFENYVRSAIKQKSMNTVEAVFYFLESRLDNVIYRMGLAPTRASARQLVSHGHIFVNGKKVNIPSYNVKVGEEVSIRAQSSQKGIFKDMDIKIKKHEAPLWISLDKEKKIGKIVSKPGGSDDLFAIFNINPIVEYYSR